MQTFEAEAVIARCGSTPSWAIADALFQPPIYIHWDRKLNWRIERGEIVLSFAHPLSALLTLGEFAEDAMPEEGERILIVKVMDRLAYCKASAWIRKSEWERALAAKKRLEKAQTSDARFTGQQKRDLACASLLIGGSRRAPKSKCKRRKGAQATVKAEKHGKPQKNERKKKGKRR